MRQPILLLVLLTLPFIAMSSHQMNGYIEYEIDNNNNLYVELHIHRDVNGIFQNINPQQLQGPINFSLTYDPSRTKITSFNDPSCGSLLDLEEYVFTGTTSLNGLVPNIQGHTFTYSLGSCLTTAQNIGGCFGAELSFTIYGKPNANGTLVWFPHGNIGANRFNTFQAYSNIRNSIDFVREENITGADSTFSQLVSPVWTPAISYTSGYSSMLPFPDLSEDPNNGPLTYDGHQSRVEFGATNGSYTEGLYGFSKEQSYFSDGILVSKNHLYGAVIIDGIKFNQPGVALLITTPDTSFNETQGPTILDYHLRPGDSIHITLAASSSLSEKLFLVNNTISDTLNWNVPAGSNFAFPKQISLNPNGGFRRSSNNQLLFSWKPTADNYVFGPDSTRFQYIFTANTCGVQPRAVWIKVKTLKLAQISSNGVFTDSLLNCGSVPKNISFRSPYSSPLFWSPGSWVVDSTLRNTQTVPGSTGWLYVVDSTGYKEDSIYIESTTNSGNGNLNPGGSGNRIFLDNPSNSVYQRWTISNGISLRSASVDTLPILGSGTYSVYSDPGPAFCQFISDTISILQDYLWASNLLPNRFNKLSKDQVVWVKGSKDKSYSMKLSMPQDARLVEELFIFGFRNTNPQDSLNLKIELYSPLSGRSIINRTITTEEHISIPLSFLLDANNEASLRLHLPEGLELQMLESLDTSLEVNYLHFSNFRERSLDSMGTVVQQSVNKRFPVGLKYFGSLSGPAEQNPQNIHLYPNPGTGLFWLDYPMELDGLEFFVFNQLGQIMHKGALDSTTSSLRLDFLKPGVYLLHLAIGVKLSFIVKP